MKKNLLPAALLAVLLAGCTKQDAEEAVAVNETEIFTEEAQEESFKINGEAQNLIEDFKDDAKVDIDFTKMNLTMIFAQSYNMILESQDYLGKTVKFEGQLFSEYNENAKTTFHAILQYDATACCQAGFELIFKDGQEVPPDGSTVEVIGKYSYTDKFGFDYFYLECSKVKVL